MKFYSGQGRVYVAKRKLDGSFERRFFCGNVPKFEVSFDTGEVVIVFEQATQETLEILCGSARRQVLLSELEPLDSGDFEPMDWSKMPNATVDTYDIGDSAPYEYGLYFQGVNTALDKDFFRLELFRVTTTTPQNGWNFISDTFASMTVKAKAHKDEMRENKIGRLHHLHKESWSGLRATDMQRAEKAIG